MKYLLLILILVGCSPKGELLTREPLQARRMALAGNYLSIRENILKPKCIGCHDEGSESPHGIDLTTYENILDQTIFPPLVTSGVPEESTLYIVVHEGKMPKDKPRLSDAEVSAIFDWIKNGAKESD